MSTQSITQQVRWQDFEVKNEVDIVLEIAQQKGWEDCEIFGSGDMITQPQESMGWKLIPADLYEYSIPAEGVSRVYQILNAGVRIQGVIIADDERNAEATPTPTKPEVSLEAFKPILSFIGKAVLGLALFAGLVAMAWLIIVWLFLPVIVLGSILGGLAYDPKLIVLVDDGKGGTVWVSLFTWYD